jgi:methyl-accepting chemotaxis protein
MSIDSPADCADRLLALAADPRFALRADDLRSLADEVVDDQLDSWVSVELVSAFPPDSSIQLPPTDRVQRDLAALVGVSVFLPIAWTWYSLHQASLAYHALIDSGQPVRETFLGLWISGFDGRLAGIHRLVPTSLISVGLIVLAALLVALHRLAATSADHKETAEAELAGASLAHELCTAQRILNRRRTDDPTRIEAIVKHSVKQLLSANTATQQAAEELREAASGVNQALTAVNTATEETRSAAAAASDSLTRFGAGVKDHLADLRSGTSEILTKSGETARSSATLVSEAVGRVDGTQHELARHLVEMSHAAREGGGAINKAVDNLELTIRDINASLTRHESAMQAQASELTAARDAAERMLRDLLHVKRQNEQARA